MPDRRVRVILEAVTGQFNSGISTARSELSGLTGVAQKNSAGFTGLGLAMVGAGTAMALGLKKAGQEAIAFESALTKSITQIGVSRTEMQAMGDAALRMSDTGKGPLELADALFFVQSAGLRGSDALDVLDASAKASSIGLGDTATVADLVTSAVNAYGIESLSAAQATDILVGTVRAGKAEAPALAAALGKVLPIASEMGVAFDEVGAAVAAMTRTGTEASTATVQLRAILTSLLKPARQSEEALNGLGLSSADLRDTIQQDGLWAALQMLRGAIGDNDEALGQIFPNVRALAGFLDLTGANAAENAIIFGDLADSTGLLGEGFDEWSKTMEASISRFSAAAESARISAMDGLNAPLTLVLDTGTSLLQMYVELPGPIRAAGTVMAGAGAAAAILGGSFLLLAPRIVATRTAMQSLRTEMPRVTGALGVLGRAAGVAGGLLAAAAAIEALHQASVEAGTGIEEMTEALLNLRKGQVDEAIGRLIEKRDALADRNIWRDIVGGLGGVVSLRHDAEELGNELESVDQALAGMVQGGHADAAADAVRALGAGMELSGDQLDEWVDRRLPGYQEALAQVRNDNELTAESIDPIELELEDLGARFGHTGEDAADAAQEMLDSWRDASGQFTDLKTAYDDVFDALMDKQQEQAEAAAEAAGKSSSEWEDFADDVKVSISDVIEEFENQLAAQQDWAENLAKIVARGVDETLFDHLVRLGPEGAGLVQAFAEATDEEFDKATAAWRESTSEGVTGVAERLAEAGPTLTEIAASHGQDIADAIALGIAEGKTLPQAIRDVEKQIDQVIAPREVEITPELNELAMRQGGHRLDDMANPRSPAYNPEVSAREETMVRRGLDRLANRRRPEYRPRVDSGSRSTTRKRLNDLAGTRRPQYRPQVNSASLSNAAARLNNLARTRYATIQAQVAVTGRHTGLTISGHTGGMVTHTGIKRMHDGGQVGNDGASLLGTRLAPDEVPAILQTRERVLSREENTALERLMRMLGNTAQASGPSFHDGGTVTAGPEWLPSQQPQVMELRITGSGALYEQLKYGVRTNQLQLTAGGNPVKVS